MPYYAVSRGHEPGIYRDWEDCEEQVSGYPDNEYRKFQCHADAWHFLNRRGYSADDDVEDCETHSEDEEEDIVYYAVSAGHILGIYTSMSDCNRQITGYKDSEFRKFHCRPDAEHFMQRRKIQYYCNGPSKANLKFIRDKYQYVIVFVSGACARSGTDSATAGIGIWFGDNHPLNVSQQFSESYCTNLAAELMAVTRTCVIAKLYFLDKVIIHTDSTYIYDCVLKLIHEWAENQWKDRTGIEVGNRELLEQLYGVWTGIRLSFRRIDPHRGIYEQRRASELARKAIVKEGDS